MKKKIFLSLIGIGIGAALLTLLFLTVGFWRTLRAQTMTVLQDTVTVIAAKATRTDDIIEFIEETAEASNHRLRFTWIGHDGRVLYETDYSAAQMENHGNRPEVVRALKEVDGVATRQSATLDHITYYAARRLPDGSVLRVAIRQDTVYAAYFSLIPYILIFLVLIGSGCFFVATNLTKRLLRPLTETADYMRVMGTKPLVTTDKEVDIPKLPATYPELSPLVDKITEQSRTIQEYIYTLEEDKNTIKRISRKQEKLRREFTANVTHELKTPLTSIQGFAEMMAAGMVGKKEDVTRFGALIVKESKRLLELINSILFLTKIEGPETQDLAVAVSLKSITESVAGFMEPVIADKKIQLHLALTEDKVMGHSDMLREVVLNLVDNAVKYNRPGGHVYVTMEKAETGRNLLFTVEDTGIGIPKDKQDRVFERFYRVEESRSKRIGGTGLGLSIVKHIIEQHHGTIALTSREHFGTKIVVTLPLYQEDNPKE